MALSDKELEASPVVANNAMNRERRMGGYAADLRFDLMTFLQQQGSWLDLCCGQGRALDEAARKLPDCFIEGVDLTDHFYPTIAPQVRLRSESVNEYEPNRKFRLITCVHGLHYVGDKLGLVARALGWLEPGGVFLAHLDCQNLRLGGRPARPGFFASHGLDYHRKFRLLRSGPRELDFGWRYLGADDKAGPNSTGQPAVNSFYSEPTE